jgi:hypothetical protein
MHEKARMVSSSPDEMPTTKVKGLPNSINPYKPPKSYKEAMSREDSAEWAEAYNKEYALSKGMSLRWFGLRRG